MNKSLLLSLPLGLALFAIPASARTHLYHGSSCQPGPPGHAGCLTNGQFGVQNNCTSIVTVECPLDSSFPGVGPNVTFVSFTGYDRSTISDVSCQVQKTDDSGNLLFTSTIATSGSGAGSQLRTTFPGVAQNGYWRMRCSIPAVQGGQVSHLASYIMLNGE
jgi:hypothetical protein